MATNKQRREAARRKLERQLAARQERARRRRRGNVIASVIGAVVVIGVVVGFIVASSGEKKKSTAASTTPTASTAATTPAVATTSAAPKQPVYPCTWTKSGTASKKATVPSTTKPAKTGSVTLNAVTNQGKMTFQLNRAGGPCAVESVVSLVKQKFYDKTSCHRLVTAGIFVLQCGDPSATGSGGPGYASNDEATGKETYPAGTIAMARSSAANSTGSQFFIVYKNSPALAQELKTQQYTVVGKVTAGLAVVAKVAKAGPIATSASKTDGKPKLAISFTSIAVAA